MYDKSKCGFLAPVSLGVGLGVASAFCMLLLAWGGWLWGFGLVMIEQSATMYYGFAPTFVGGIYGALWGFIDGFVFGLITAWFYNLCLSCRCCKKYKACCDTKESCHSDESVKK